MWRFRAAIRGCADHELPADADADNVYQVQVTADDGAGRTAVQDLSVTVTPVNDNNPVITSSATPSLAENTTSVASFRPPTRRRPDRQLQHYGGVDSALFQIVGGQLQFVACADYELPADADADNVYQVQVTADDAAGYSRPAGPERHRHAGQ